MNEFLFWLIAPYRRFGFMPEYCPISDKSKCGIWTCGYHFKDNKYSSCQKIQP